MNEVLHEALLGAHERGDLPALAHMYGQAAFEAETRGEVDTACFFFTQAYVFALDAGLPDATAYNRKLAHYGRDVLRGDLSDD